MDALFLERRFRIAAADHVLAALAPELLPRLSVAAPAVELELCGLPPALPALSAAGGADLTLLSEPPLEHHYVHARLYVDELVALVRPRHPMLRGKEPPRLDLDGLLSSRHVDLVGPEGTSASVAAALAGAGLNRRVAVGVHSALLAAQLVPGTDRIAVLPHGFARRLASQLGLVVADLPLTLPLLEVSMLWPPSLDGDPAHRWFRDRVREAGRRLDRRHHDARFGPR